MFDSIIAKEGQKYILIAFIAMIIFVLVNCKFLTFISFVMIFFLIYIYRYKYIDFKSFKKNEIIAPISGTISAIDVKDLKKSIYINVSLCDSHILRNLEEGPCKISIRKGLNLFLSTFKSKVLNEQAKLEYANSSMHLYSSLYNPSIELPNNKSFEKGEKIGTFIQGEVIVTLNKEFATLVKIGDKVISGQSILGKKEENK